ncbi:MAG: hypothetical protein N3E52_03605 [Candidatus Bathyarchaeota archaeon]|nr:hypothetical protein [Candidatus Bathyarchaeota archaeon]
MIIKKQIGVFCFLLLIFWATTSANIHDAKAESVRKAKTVWEKTYGGKGDDRAFSAIGMPEGFLVVGSTTSLQPNTTMAWALKIDNEGNMLWNRTFNDQENSEFRYVLLLHDGFLFIGNKFHASGDTDGYVVKTDEKGEPIWEFSLNNGGVDKLFSAAKTQDGFLLVGLTNAIVDHGFDVWIIKITEGGHLIWSKTYGWEMDDAGRAVAISADSQYFVAGYTNSAGNGDYDFLLLKIDVEGNLLWNRTYGGVQSDKAYLIVNAHNGFLLVGDTRSKGKGDSDAWIIKVNSEGNPIWDRTIGGSNFDVPTCISILKTGDYVVGGFTFSFGEGYRDFWLFKINDEGNILWQATTGKGGYDEAYGIIEVADNAFIMAGWTNSIGQGAYDFYIVKVNVANSEDPWLLYVVACLVVILPFAVILVLLKRKRVLKNREFSALASP